MTNSQKQDFKIVQLENRIQALEGTNKNLFGLIKQILENQDKLINHNKQTKSNTDAIHKEYVLNTQNVSDLDLHKELLKRGLNHKSADLDTLAMIIGRYDITGQDVLNTLDRIATQNKKTPIRNLIGYATNTFRHDHILKLRKEFKEA